MSPVVNDNVPDHKNFKILTQSSIENVKHNIKRFFLYDPERVAFAVLPSDNQDIDGHIDVKQVCFVHFSFL